MDHKQRVQEVMGAMSKGRVALLFEAMAEDVTWRWMGVNQWSLTFEGKQIVVDKLFGGATETIGLRAADPLGDVHPGTPAVGDRAFATSRAADSGDEHSECGLDRGAIH